MSHHLNQAFGANVALVERCFGRPGAMLVDPEAGPADEIGSEQHAGFLEENGGGGADLEVMQEENLLVFLDPGFHRLAAVIEKEPILAVCGDGIRAEMEQNPWLGLFISNVKSL